jgi:putative ABC transport system ATP-binding protein
VIELKKLKKIYKLGKSNQVDALQGVSLKIESGEVIAIVGPSGSGKSTILNILGGLDFEYDGEVLVENIELKDYNPNDYHREVLGTIFQQFYLVPSLTVAENIMLPIMFGRQISMKTANERLDYILDRVGLSDRRDHRPNELSGGQAQRVAIARALITQPKVLLADEPTGNLDSKTGAEIIELLYELNREENTTLIIVTHDENVIKGVKNRVYLIDGKLSKKKNV